MPNYGIDVSNFNAVPDWPAAHRNGISFASVKLTQGNYYASPAAAGQVAGARSAAVTVGGYHFADSNIAAAAQADYFASRAQPLGVTAAGSFLPMLDIENDPADHITWSPAAANAFVPAWIARLRQQTGVTKVAVYASLSFWGSVLRPDVWADENVALWVAVYNGQPGNTSGYAHKQLALHQHTDKGVVPGVAGNVDRNVTVGSWTLADLTLGDDMTPDDILDAPITRDGGGTGTTSLRAIGAWSDAHIDAINGRINAVAAKVDALATPTIDLDALAAKVAAHIRLTGTVVADGQPTT